MTTFDARRQAAQYMHRRGYGLIEPRDIQKVGGIDCWYFVYDLPNGQVLELEMSHEKGQWVALVTALLQPQT